MGAISSRDTMGGQNNLPELVGSCTERTGTGKEIILPHPKKTFIILFLQGRPVALEVFIPVQEGLVIVGPESMPVLQYKKTFNGSTDLFSRGQHGIGKDILLNPAVSSLL